MLANLPSSTSAAWALGQKYPSRITLVFLETIFVVSIGPRKNGEESAI
ncbi:MAG: hypothetical protein FWH04_05175 [Oscillospiraceae bacterium]|nr:hypothetical protein [Oscillospiraceae bacterium]